MRNFKIFFIIFVVIAGYLKGTTLKKPNNLKNNENENIILQTAKRIEELEAQTQKVIKNIKELSEMKTDLPGLALKEQNKLLNKIHDEFKILYKVNCKIYDTYKALYLNSLHSYNSKDSQKVKEVDNLAAAIKIEEERLKLTKDESNALKEDINRLNGIRLGMHNIGIGLTLLPHLCPKAWLITTIHPIAPQWDLHPPLPIRDNIRTIGLGPILSRHPLYHRKEWTLPINLNQKILTQSTLSNLEDVD